MPARGRLPRLLSQARNDAVGKVALASLCEGGGKTAGFDGGREENQTYYSELPGFILSLSQLALTEGATHATASWRAPVEHRRDGEELAAVCEFWLTSTGENTIIIY